MLGRKRIRPMVVIVGEEASAVRMTDRMADELVRRARKPVRIIRMPR